MNIEIREERSTDYWKVEELTREAFWNLYKPGCDEHYLVHTMRSHPDFIKELDFVAVKDGEIVGSILYSKSHVINEDGTKIDTATFGPVCVHPKYQRQGIGSALIKHTAKLAAEMGYPAVIIYGDPHNYFTHGFRNGKDYQISTMDGKHPFGLLVLEIKKGIFKDHSWKYKESDLYMFDETMIDEYDKQFPAKEKRKHYNQDLFMLMLRSVVE